jgi:hypothetical protein
MMELTDLQKGGQKAQAYDIAIATITSWLEDFCRLWAVSIRPIRIGNSWCCNIINSLP